MEDSIQYYKTGRETKTAVVLVLHGLNVKPSAMLPLIRFLNGYGADAYLVQLTGHGASVQSGGGISATSWPQEIDEGYRLARQAADAYSVPLYLLGFSLGALMGQMILGAAGKFDKQVLLAPATALRRRCYLLRAFFFLGKIPSFTPVGYRCNRFVPVAFYQALFAAEKKLLNTGFTHQHLPTLILIDPRDELVSYKKLQEQVKHFRLTNYEIVTLDPSLKGRRTIYHHLILDEATMGKENWQLATRKMAAFLFGQ